MVAGSLTLWATPASAVDLTENDLCVQLFGVYWEITNFVDDGLTTTYTTGEQSITFLSTVDLSVYDDFEDDFDPRIEFFMDDQCVGFQPDDGDPDTDDGNPYADSLPPENFKMCVTATPGAVSSFDLRFRKFPSDDYGQYLISDASLDFDYDFLGLTGGSYIGGNPDPDDGYQPVPAWPPSRIQPENFVLDPSFTGTLEIQIVLAVDPVCGLSGGSGGRGPSIDLDHYIERAAAETSSLPDTL